MASSHRMHTVIIMIQNEDNMSRGKHIVRHIQIWSPWSAPAAAPGESGGQEGVGSRDLRRPLVRKEEEEEERK